MKQAIKNKEYSMRNIIDAIITLIKHNEINLKNEQSGNNRLNIA